MSSGKAAQYQEPQTMAETVLPDTCKPEVPVRLPNVIATGSRAAVPLRSVPVSKKPDENGSKFQPRMPVITGEATYRGPMGIDGIISGQMNASGVTLNIKQRPRNGKSDVTPELDGEISFKEVLRVNGHVAGKVLSEKGMLIVAAGATVQALIQVGIAVISGTVAGDIVGYERVELGPTAIVHGKISTPRLTIKPGAIFQGDSRLLKNGNNRQLDEIEERGWNVEPARPYADGR